MNEPNQPKTGGLWARMLNVQADDEKPTEARVPLAEPVVAADAVFAAVPVAHPTTPIFTATPVVVEEPASPESVSLEVFTAPAVTPAPPAVVIEPTPIVEENLGPCGCCGSPRKSGQLFCDDCGYHFPANEPKSPAAVSSSPATSPRETSMPPSGKITLKKRYELGELISDRQGVRRHRGVDLTTKQAIVVVSAPAVELAVALADDVPVIVLDDDDIMPSFDDDIPVAVLPDAGSGAWPSPGWEKSVLDKANHPSLPKVVELFVENGTEYLIEEIPPGQSLWEAWFEPDADIRYGYLQTAAEAIHALHKAGAMLEGFRPDLVTVSDTGELVISDLTDLLPFPLPASPPIRGTLYTAPELILSPQTADARAALYSFGASLYSLEYLSHSLEEKDFEKQFSPRQITDRFPDVHPLLLRLVNKTFVRDVNTRFPTDEAGRTDPSGMVELIKTLEVCRRTFDLVRLDIAAWTTTGVVRTGNEDALAFLHGVETRQDDLHEYAMLLLCDGMGGYEAGEVAAAMCLSSMRTYLLQQPMFAALAGKEPPTNPADAKAYQQVLSNALKHANKEVFTASRTPGGKGRRGMGCTAEAVYVDSKNVIVGHVGDSRTYHLHKGRLVQLTRDQTLVNRLVELGQISAEEAENHPRKNELQQAIGGQPDVMPGTYCGKLQRGDWVVVCSDGLSNHISNIELEKMLTRETANSAEEAARRLLNLTNLRGATDNATVIVIRAS